MKFPLTLVQRNCNNLYFEIKGSVFVCILTFMCLMFSSLGSTTNFLITSYSGEGEGGGRRQGGNLNRASKCVVSWYPGQTWQQITDWANGTVSHQGIVNSLSVGEMNISKYFF